LPVLWNLKLKKKKKLEPEVIITIKELTNTGLNLLLRSHSHYMLSLLVWGNKRLGHVPNTHNKMFWVQIMGSFKHLVGFTSLGQDPN
jgi:hypothetical protein